MLVVEMDRELFYTSVRGQLLYPRLAMVVTSYHDEPLRILDCGFLSLNSKFVCALSSMSTLIPLLALRLNVSLM